MFELYTVMCGGPDGVGLVSRTGFTRALASAMLTYNFKVRDNKTVSKCETCKFILLAMASHSTLGVLLRQLITTSKREHKPKITELMAAHRDFVRQCRSDYHMRRLRASTGYLPTFASIIIDGKLHCAIIILVSYRG